jgi:hypothetical protein
MNDRLRAVEIRQTVRLLLDEPRVVVQVVRDFRLAANERGVFIKPRLVGRNPRVRKFLLKLFDSFFNHGHDSYCLR